MTAKGWEKFRRPRCRVPSVFQLENAECGPAALTMILQYYQRNVSLETVRDLCQITARDGSSARDLIRVAGACGLGAQARRMGALKVRTLSCPVIIHWRFNHFIVLEGIQGHTFYLRDACTGGFKVSREEFERHFTGIVIRFWDTADQPTAFQKVSFLKKGGGAFRYLSLTNPMILLYLMVAVAGLGVSLCLPVCIQRFFDRAPTDAAALVWPAAAAAVWALLIWLEKHLVFVNQQQAAQKTGDQQMTRFGLRSGLFFNARHHISRRLGVCTFVFDDLLKGMVTPVLSLAGFVGLEVLYCWISPSLGPVLAVLGLAGLMVELAAGQRRLDLTWKAEVKTGAFDQAMAAELSRIEAVKSTGTEQETFERAAMAQGTMINDTCDLNSEILKTALAADLLRAAGLVAVVAGFLSRSVSFGTAAALGLMVIWCFDHAKKAAGLGYARHKARQMLAALDDVMGGEAENPPADGSDGSAGGKIELKGVSFGYNRFDPPRVSDFSLTVHPGETIGVWGPSGSGKTMVARIAAGRYAPWSGRVLLDGTPVTARSPKTPGAVVLVEEASPFFGGTIRDNLTLFNQGFYDRDMVRACKTACIHGDILALPGGYDSLVTEQGLNLSGGQRQRLAVARALLSGPAVLILDEALSALDAPTGLQVIANLKERGISCILLSHNRHWLKQCHWWTSL